MPWPGAGAGITPGRPLPAVIDDYVRAGLASNLSLRAQSLEVERAEATLDAARARYFPEIGFAARYTKSHGGREIELPLGTMLNPAYQTLNELLAAQGEPPRFATLQDETIAFLRETEQDTRLTLRMPLLAPAIPAAVRAQRELLGASEYSRQALARSLKRDITVGYLHWLMAIRNQGIVEASLALLNENLRVNESLNRNGKVTEDQVLRARAELLQVTQQSREAQNLAAQAQSYLNFLLNRSLDTPLENAEIAAEVTATTRALTELRQAAIDNRPELAELEHLKRASEAQTSVANADLWPTLSLGADGGIQGEEYEFGRGSNYYTVSLLLNWTFFDGGARRAAVRQADGPARAAPRRSTTNSPSRCSSKYSSRSTGSNASADSLATAAARSEAARAAFRIASRKRDEGVIRQVEFIDARSALTGAELNLNVTRFEVLARQAELDYATAAGTLPLGPPHERNYEKWNSRHHGHGRIDRRRVAARRLRQGRSGRSRTRHAGAHRAGQPGTGGAPYRHQRHGGHQTRDAPVVQDGRPGETSLRAAGRSREERPAPGGDRAHRSRRAGGTGTADGGEGAARPEARRESLCRPGHQPRAVAGICVPRPPCPPRHSRPRNSISATR